LREVERSAGYVYAIKSLRGVFDEAIQNSRLWTVLFKETIVNTGLPRLRLAMTEKYDFVILNAVKDLEQNKSVYQHGKILRIRSE
jgi:hypothetical protein